MPSTDCGFSTDAAAAVISDPSFISWGNPDAAAAGMTAEGLAALWKMLERRQTLAAAVLRGGVLAGEWAAGGAGSETHFPVYSITKAFAALAVGILAGEPPGLLDQPVCGWVPEWRADERRGILVRHLLSMSSGVEKADESLYRQPDQFAYAASRPLIAPPGERWEYANTPCALLGPIITSLAGRRMSDFLADRLYAPLGLAPGGHWEAGPHTVPYTGLRLSVRDLAALGQLFLNRGLWQARRLVSADFLSQATTPSPAHAGYGLLWWVNANGQWPDLPADAYAARGIYGNELLIVPSHELIVVRLVGDQPRSAVPLNHMGKLALAACVSAT